MIVVEFNQAFSAYTYYDFFDGFEYQYQTGDLWQFDADQYKDSEKKIALVACPFLLTPSTDLSMFDLVIISDCESCDHPTDQRIKSLQSHFNNDNIVVITGGVRTGLADTDRFLRLPWLMLEVSVANDPHYVDFDLKKPKLFDALLGFNRPHRRMIVDFLRENNLLDHGYVSLLEFDPEFQKNFPSYRSPDLDQVEEKNVLGSIHENSMIYNSFKLVGEHPSRPGMKYRASVQVPWTVYRNSYFSVVAETRLDLCEFLTEKTAKPLYAGRPFVLIGPRHSLKYLRSLGFKTFSDFIDESYDAIDNSSQRFKMALQQIKKLCQMDHDGFRQMYHGAWEILKYNQRLISNHAHFCDPIKQKISKFLRNI